MLYKACTIACGGVVAAAVVAIGSMANCPEATLSIPHNVLHLDKATLAVLAKLEQYSVHDAVAYARVVVHSDRLVDISMQLARSGDGCAEDRIRAFIEFRQVSDSLERLSQNTPVAKESHKLLREKQRLLSLLRGHLGAVFSLTER